MIKPQGEGKGFDTFVGVHKERRLDTPRVFLYNGKPWENPRWPLRWLVEGLELLTFGRPSRVGA
jgi:hypothetical protein